MTHDDDTTTDQDTQQAETGDEHVAPADMLLDNTEETDTSAVADDTGTAPVESLTAQPQESADQPTATRITTSKHPHKSGRRHCRPKAVQKIVAAAVNTVPGVYQESTGIDKLTGSWPRYDVRVDEEDSSVSVDCVIGATWPSPVVKVAEKVRETVIKHITTYLDVPIVAVNVTVAHVEPGHPRLTTADIAAFTAHPTATPVTVDKKSPRVDIVVPPIPFRDCVLTDNPAADAVRSITTPQPVEIHPFTVKPPVVVSGVDVPEPATVTGVSVPKPVTVRGVSAPRPAQVAHVAAPTPIDVVHVKTPSPVAVTGVDRPRQWALSPITVADPPTVTVPTQPAPKKLVPITLADSWDLSPITIDDRVSSAALKNAHRSLAQVEELVKRSLVPVTVTAERPLTQVDVHPTPLQQTDTPKPWPLTQIQELAPHRLQEVTVARPLRLATPEAPDLKLKKTPVPPEQRLARITYARGRVTHPKAPVAMKPFVPDVPQVVLADITVKPVTLTPVTVTPRALHDITVNPTPIIDEVDTPPTPRPATVTIDGVEIVDVKTPRPTPLRNPAAPASTPLTPITIHPDNVRTVK